MARVVLIAAFLLPTCFAANAGTWDKLRELVSIHAKASEFDRCKTVCGRGGNARSCCICFGGDWFGSLKGGHCG